ncbi:MAG: GntR family transcriptional regulator [Bryobacteraceae bacterium]
MSSLSIARMPAPVSIAETVANTLQAEIISGQYTPGQRLVERQLGERFQVSSIPVREALQILETRGLVMKRLNRGCTVIDLSVEEMVQMCELRDLLEPKVAEWAACRRTEAEVERLREHLARLREAAQSGSLARFFSEDLEFHRCLWDLADNPSAARALMTVVGCLFACGLRQADVDLRHQYAKHERLFQAIADSRPSDAALLLADISAGFRGQLHRKPQDHSR